MHCTLKPLCYSRLSFQCSYTFPSSDSGPFRLVVHVSFFNLAHVSFGANAVGLHMSECLGKSICGLFSLSHMEPPLLLARSRTVLKNCASESSHSFIAHTKNAVLFKAKQCMANETTCAWTQNRRHTHSLSNRQKYTQKSTSADICLTCFNPRQETKNGNGSKMLT